MTSPSAGLTPQTVIEPGIYPNMPVEEYAALPGMRQSVLKAFNIDSEEGREVMTNGRDDTEALLEGTALHTAAIEPGRFAHDFEVWQKVEGKAGAAFENDRKAALSRGVSLYRSDWGIEAMVEALRKHPQSSALFGASGLVGGLAEVSLAFDIDGVPCKYRADGLFPENGVLVDIKSTSCDLRTYSVEGEAATYGYYFQAAFGLRGLRALYPGVERWRAFTVWVGKKRPHKVRVTEMGETAWAVGDYLVDAAWATYRRCVHSGDWTAYPHVDELIPPSFLIKQMEEAKRAKFAFSGDEA